MQEGLWFVYLIVGEIVRVFVIPWTDHVWYIGCDWLDLVHEGITEPGIIVTQVVGEVSYM